MSPSPSSTAMPVIPPARGGEGRRRPRKPARGLHLTCTRFSYSRASNLPNLSRELLDIGWGGVMFKCAEPIEMPCPVNLQIREDSTTEVFHARGEIAWTEVRRLDGQEVWFAGARFDEILTPASKCARFFDDRSPVLADAPSARPDPMRRVRDRFAVEGAEFSLNRETSFLRRFLKTSNIAHALADVSRTGAQFICGESLRPGDRVRVQIHLPKFKDTLVACARVMWASLTATPDGRAWRIGVEFSGLDRAQHVLLGSMESWFSRPGPRPAVKSKVRPPSA